MIRALKLVIHSNSSVEMAMDNLQQGELITGLSLPRSQPVRHSP